MLPDRQASAGVVGDQTLLSIHLCSGRASDVFPEPDRYVCLSSGPSELAGAFHLPESIAPMLNSIELIQSADTRQQCQFFAVEQGNAQREIFR